MVALSHHDSHQAAPSLCVSMIPAVLVHYLSLNTVVIVPGSADICISFSQELVNPSIKYVLSLHNLVVIGGPDSNNISTCLVS